MFSINFIIGIFTLKLRFDAVLFVFRRLEVFTVEND